MRTGFVVALLASAGEGRCEVTATRESGKLSSTSWTACGWGGGGFFWSCVFHPARSGAIYMGGDVAGAYKTEDHGKHWRLINDGLASYGVFSLAVDRRNPETVYAATDGGLCKSVDGGARWEVLPRTGPSDLRITGEKGRSIRSVAVDPSDGRIVYAASPAGKVYKSSDGGRTWNVAYRAKVPAGAGEAGPVYSVAVAAKDPSLVLAATEGAGLVLSEDGGRTWHGLHTPVRASCGTFAPSDPNVIYGSFFQAGIWKSTDKGKTWTAISDGPAKDVAITEVVVSPLGSSSVYAIGTGAASEWEGHVLRSVDGGETWEDDVRVTVDPSGGDPTVPGDLGAGLGISTPSNLAINPLNPRELFLAGNWRPWLSEDGGRTWTERARGADISCITDIRFRNGHTYVSCMDEGVFVSEDDGKQWRQSWPPKYDPAYSGHYWRLGFTAVRGVDRILSTLSPWSDAPGCVVFSDDGGKTYTATKAGLPDFVPVANTMWGKGYPRALAVDPGNPGIVYLGIDGDPADGNQGGGIFKSEDGGSTWERLPGQPGSRRVFYGLAVDPTDSRRLYWAGCGEHGGLYQSVDGGASWKGIFTKETWPFNLLVTSEGAVYCAGANLWRSSDHGRTWAQLTRFENRGSIVGLEVHPRDSRAAWISLTDWDGANSGGGVFRTRDGGATWEDITGDLPCRKPLVLRFNGATNELWAGGASLFKLRQP